SSPPASTSKTSSLKLTATPPPSSGDSQTGDPHSSSASTPTIGDMGHSSTGAGSGYEARDLGGGYEAGDGVTQGRPIAVLAR
ncbi:MAG: hypothetical protein QOE57_32, partial [Acidimicrobiaceae bacterium]|nr:hypothetical protein [Acidimicrobiaceae bacterium]